MVAKNGKYYYDDDEIAAVEWWFKVPTKVARTIAANLGKDKVEELVQAYASYLSRQIKPRKLKP